MFKNVPELHSNFCFDSLYVTPPLTSLNKASMFFYQNFQFTVPLVAMENLGEGLSLSGWLKTIQPTLSVISNEPLTNFSLHQFPLGQDLYSVFEFT